MKKHFFLVLAVAGLLVMNDHTSLLAQNRHGSRHQQVKKPKPRAHSSVFPGQFPESSERLLTEKDVEHQTVWGMKVMMNEIYARQGYVFRDPDLRKHFRKEKWYKGKERNFNKVRVSSIEVQNVAFIKQHLQNATR